MARPNPRYGAATSFVKKGGIVDSVYDFLQGFNIENPTGQQESYLTTLPTTLIPLDYDKSKLDQSTIQSLSEIGIKPSTSLADARSRINKFNNKMIQKADLSVIDDSLTNTELNQVKKEIEDLKIKGQEYKSNKEAWNNFLLPSAFAEHGLSNQITQIINDINTNVIQIPNWFQNNIEWVQSGHITQQEFLAAYNDGINRGYIHTTPTAPKIPLEPIIQEPPKIDDSINTNMVTQQMINFNIINGRAVGSIRFVATENFNPYYYGKNIINMVQFKDPNGANIGLVKQNTLNFTETEKDEVINYDEDMNGNTRATVESFVWEWMDKPAGAFSKMYSIDISETERPKPKILGFMSAGIAGAIGILILIGFIADHKRGK